MGTKSVLRWAGSKQKLLPKLCEFWVDPTRRYVEPFAGSSRLFFSLLPSKALLGDINTDLVLFLNCAKSNPQEVYKIASKWPSTSSTYYRIRAEKPRAAAKRAARFLYLNRYCFNGIYRINKKGDFNVPYSGSRTGEFPTWKEFESFSQLLKRADVVCEDFQSLLAREVCSSDFVYLDPPYALANRRVFQQYGPDSFGLLDLKRLAESLRLIDRRGALFVLSYAYCSEAIEHFSGWHQQRVFCQRNVAGFASSRRRAAELIISNFARE